jgi:translation initiation factor IF-1
MGSWATPHIERLQRGETVQFRPVGGSMRGKVNSGDLVTVEPLTDQELTKGMIVLCKVSGNHYLHLIKALQGEPKTRFQIGNNKGGINGWITRTGIYGICTKVGE